MTAGEQKTDTTPIPRPVPVEPARRSSRGWVLVAVIVVTGLVVGGFSLMTGETGDAVPDATASVDPIDFEEAVVTNLVETQEYEGTLGRLLGEDVAIRLAGTVTAVPEAGATLSQGDVLVWVDNRPVVLLTGELPAWRSMAEDFEGPDVLQLESALTALGFNEDESRMTVDETYTSATEAVVSDWQESMGADDDGVVDLGEVVFITEPIRVDELLVDVGDVVQSGSPVAASSSDELEVTFGLPTSEQGALELGSTVVITLPDTRETTGTVTDIATVATREEGAEPTFEVVVALDDVSVTEGIDEVPVTVEVVTDGVEDVIAVPVEALLALREGGYAVEVESGTGTTLVPVEPGFYADGLIEVTGQIAPGDRVVVP
jgi:peptidoglycan hydrolase-like protein with peptidoglycan-binding domain